MDQEADAIVDEFMGDNPRVGELVQMRDALRSRLDAFRREREAAPDGAERLDRDIAAIKRQLAAVEREMVVSEFVEASVRAALARPRPQDKPLEEP